ncbi:MAG: AraC family transcriptional regulator, partial [Eubacterium sp.]|nr:AraC family transcriptional regulator [Eubacterium sp.]
LNAFLPIETALRNAYYKKDSSSVHNAGNTLSEEVSLPVQTSDPAENRFKEIMEVSSSGKYDVLTLRSPRSRSDETPVHVTKHIRYLPPRKHVHEFFEFFYVLRGNCRHICDNQSYSIKSGDLCFWQYGIPHMILSNSDDLLAVNILLTKSDFSRYFSLALQQQNILESYFSRILYGDGESPMVIFHTGDDERVSYLICRMYQEYSKRPLGWQTSLTSCLSFLLVHLLREHSEHISTSSNTDRQDQALKILQYIQDHSDTITFDKLCEAFSYAPAYLSRLIRKKTGMTFSQIIAHHRLEQAAWLLERTDLGIGQVASQVGYADAGYFSRLFHNTYGMLPKEYRISCKKKV